MNAFNTDCPQAGAGGHHSSSYGEDGDGQCAWCGERPEDTSTLMPEIEKSYAEGRVLYRVWSSLGKCVYEGFDAVEAIDVYCRCNT